MASRTLKIVCAVSLLLNIFLVGGLAGGALWWRTMRPLIGAGSIRMAGSELSSSQRRAFRTALREERKTLRPTIVAGRQARLDAAALLRAPTLDQAALGGALARVRDADFLLRSKLEDRAIRFVATLPADERLRLAEGLERRAGPPRK